MRNDNGQFLKGNPGKPKGAVSNKTKQWHALNEAIINDHSERFKEYLNSLWEGDLKDQQQAAELYLKVLEYFKPKLQRSEVKQDSTIHEMKDLTEEQVNRLIEKL